MKDETAQKLKLRKQKQNSGKRYADGLWAEIITIKPFQFFSKKKFQDLN